MSPTTGVICARAKRNGSVRIVIYATQYARGVCERTRVWRQSSCVLKVAAMGKKMAVLTAACAALIGVVATPASAKAPKVVKARFQASYTFAGMSGSTWDLPADQFCSGVRWAENARAV